MGTRVHWALQRRLIRLVSISSDSFMYLFHSKKDFSSFFELNISSIRLEAEQHSMDITVVRALFRNPCFFVSMSTLAPYIDISNKTFVFGSLRLGTSKKFGSRGSSSYTLRKALESDTSFSVGGSKRNEKKIIYLQNTHYGS